MSYILDNLIIIRKHREKRALNQVLINTRKADDAERLKKESRKELTEYINWRKNEETQLFDRLKNQPVKIHDIIRFNDQLEAFKNNQDSMGKKLDDAEKKHIQAENSVISAKKEYAGRYRDSLKLKEHKSDWETAVKQEAEQQVEKELDAFVQVKKIYLK